MEMSRAIDAALFDWPAAEPALKASRCPACGTLDFPARVACRRCGSLGTTCVHLPRHGTLWTWTIQRFRPKPPYRGDGPTVAFNPYGLGYIELGESICIESRLTESDPGKLKIGARMELVIFPAWVEDDGSTVMSYAFKPV